VQEPSQQNQPKKNNTNQPKKKLPTGQRRRGAPKGNRNAAKIGEDLRFEMYLSKVRRTFFEEWFVLKFGRPPTGEEELREAARQLASTAIDRAILEEFERDQPGRTSGTGEVF
jgi:hypothetical protein